MEFLLGQLLAYLMNLAAGLRTEAIGDSRARRIQEQLAKDTAWVRAIQDLRPVPPRARSPTWTRSSRPTGSRSSSADAAHGSRPGLAAFTAMPWPDLLSSSGCQGTLQEAAPSRAGGNDVLGQTDL
jgi:hypothetical protein